jgi:hypothetical protein
MSNARKTTGKSKALRIDDIEEIDRRLKSFISCSSLERDGCETRIVRLQKEIEKKDLKIGYVYSSCLKILTKDAPHELSRKRLLQIVENSTLPNRNAYRSAIESYAFYLFELDGRNKRAITAENLLNYIIRKNEVPAWLDDERKNLLNGMIKDGQHKKKELKKMYETKKEAHDALNEVKRYQLLLEKAYTISKPVLKSVGRINEFKKRAEDYAGRTTVKSMLAERSSELNKIGGMKNKLVAVKLEREKIDCDILNAKNKVKEFFAANIEYMNEMISILKNIELLCRPLIKIRIERISPWEIGIAKRLYPQLREELSPGDMLRTSRDEKVYKAFDLLISGNELLDAYNFVNEQKKYKESLDEEIKQMELEIEKSMTGHMIGVKKVAKEMKYKLTETKAEIRKSKKIAKENMESMNRFLREIRKDYCWLGYRRSPRPMLEEFDAFWQTIKSKVSLKLSREKMNEIVEKVSRRGQTTQIIKRKAQKRSKQALLEGY